MVRRTKKTFLPKGAAESLKAFMRRLLGLAILAGGLVVLVALLSADARDPSINTAVDSEIHNWLGRFGANLADILTQLLGLGVYTALGAILFWGLKLTTKAEAPTNWRWRAMALPLVTLLASTAWATLPLPDFRTLLAGTGGAFGHLILTGISNLAGVNLGWLVGPVAGVLAAIGFVYCLGLTRQDKAGISHVAGISADLAQRTGAATAAAAGAAGAALGRTIQDVKMRKEPVLGVPHGESSEVYPRTEFEQIGDVYLDPVARNTTEEPLVEEYAPVQPEAPEPRGALIDAKRPPPPAGKREIAERQPSLGLVADEEDLGYELPPLTLLTPTPENAGTRISQDGLAQNAKMLESVLDDFGVNGEVVKVRPGPVVTLYELEPAPGTKTARVIGLADDIARSMSALSVRIATIPGRSVIGIELPNVKREIVYLRELLASEQFEKAPAKLTLVLGKDIGGGPVMVDLARMPHLLIAGTTGSGKSVAVNTMILSLLYRLTPDECRLIMIDPKMLELSVYDGIPHLLAPVVTEPGKAVVALKWAVREMEDRYRAMSQLGVRNIAGYNQRLAEARAKGEELTRTIQTGFDPETGKPVYEEQLLDLKSLPFIVIVVDEMADLMLVAGKDIEAAVQRLAQMARAAGIHLIMATQRPSVDVITGTIKANFPTRISFQVTSKIDSRTILGEQGAEQLLGQGDMLYMASGGRITRVHGPFVSDQEVEHVVDHLRGQGRPNYVEAVTEEEEELGALHGVGGGQGGSGDELYDQAVAVVAREGKASTSFIQRHLQIGYNRAARLIERMEAEGIVGKPNHVGKREILVRQTQDY